MCRDFGSFFESDLPAEQAAHRRFRDVRIMALAAHAFHVFNEQREKRVIHVDQPDVTVADSLRASAVEYAPPAHPDEGVIDFGDDAVNLSERNTPMGVGMPLARTDDTTGPVTARPDVASSTPATCQPGALGREFGRPPRGERRWRRSLVARLPH